MKSNKAIIKTKALQDVTPMTTLGGIVADAVAKQEAINKKLGVGRFLVADTGISKFKETVIKNGNQIELIYRLFQQGKKKSDFKPIGGYSYMRDARGNFGSSSVYSAFLEGESYANHSYCQICNGQRTSVVNGICLACTTKH